MKKRSTIIIIMSLLLLGGLVIWQIKQLKEFQKLRSEIELQEMQVILMESAIELRKAENKNDTLRTDIHKKKKLINYIILKNFKKFDSQIQWGLYNGLGEPIDGLNTITDHKEFINSSLKVCISCLITIEIVNNKEVDEITKNANDERGYVLDQTPAQMRDMKGLDMSTLKYIHIYRTPSGIDASTYLIPSLFLVTLSSLFMWVLYLNNKQSKLIKQKNEFINHLSHQFQTPLSSIKLSANLLSAKETTSQDELIQIIQTESNRLENHIKTILHWVKSDADRLHINKKSIGVTDTIEQSLKQMKLVFLTNHTIVNFIPPEEEIYLMVDVDHLQLMFFNIWENAIKHNEHPISLKIDCNDIGTHFCISTSDNGKGMQKNMIVENFKGLGLEYVKRIMEEHNGTMELKSSAKQGLTVHLNFPK